MKRERERRDRGERESEVEGLTNRIIIIPLRKCSRDHSDPGRPGPPVREPDEVGRGQDGLQDGWGGTLQQS